MKHVPCYETLYFDKKLSAKIIDSVTTPILEPLSLENVALFATGGDFRAAILVVIEIVILTTIWTPFIMMNDKMTAGEAE